MRSTSPDRVLPPRTSAGDTAPGMTGKLRAAATVAVMCIACDSTPPSTTAEPRAAAPAPSDLESVAPKPSRGTMVGGQSMRRIVAWPDDTQRDDQARERLTAQTRVAVDDAPVPVLIPTGSALVESAVVTSGAHWAAVSMQAEGLHVSLQVSGQAKIYPHIKPVPATHSVRGLDGFVTRNEGIWVASWIEHGVAYDLELECADQAAPECADRDALMELAESLQFVGGRGAQR